MTRAYTKRAPANPRGKNWQSIHDNLGMLARRVVSEKGSLEEIQQIYGVMAIAKKYDEMTSTAYIAKKLELKAQRAAERAEEDFKKKKVGRPKKQEN